MSIRMIARDLYRLQQEIDQLEKKFMAASYDKRPMIANRLRKVKAERDRMKNALEGQKSNTAR